MPKSGAQEPRAGESKNKAGNLRLLLDELLQKENIDIEVQTKDQGLEHL